MQRLFLFAFVSVLGGLVLTAAPAEPEILLEDFEQPGAGVRWSFSNGPEFPGAAGKLGRAEAAARHGRLGGKLEFDFSNGGRYVAALAAMPESGPTASEPWNALRLWIKRPEGNDFTFRYTDSEEQTFQKQVECPAEVWAEVTIPFTGWTGHWGGANDGKVRGRPKTLSLLVDQGQHRTGAVFFDDLRLVRHESVTARVAFPLFRFTPEEGWRMRAEGNPGASRLEGKQWTLDFSQGARSISIAVPDQTIPGSVDRIRVRTRGVAAGHPVRVIVRTHFMTFHKVIGEWSGGEVSELVTEGPPGPGWEWHGGENDGKIHGPLRLVEIQVAANGRQDRSTLELEEIVIDGSCPAEKRCVLLAETSGGENPAFAARVRALTEQPLTGRVTWVVRDWEGNEVGQGERAITVPERTRPAEIRVPVASAWRTGRTFLEATFQLDIEGQQAAPATAVWLAEFPGHGDSALEPESPFGMGVYLNRYGGDARGLALMEQAAKTARAAGVKWSREDFSWGRIEPRRGEYDWAYYDELVACARRNGITVYGIICYWSGWTKPYTEEGIADYVNFARALVRRYHKEIQYWEIWNEPNIFFWQGPRDMYADLLKRSYAAIKEEDPHAQVLGLSTAGIDNAYIKRMLELGAPFDILTIHPYRKRLDDQGFIQDLKNVSDQVTLPDGRRRPVWLTEMGWATHMPHNTINQDFAPNPQRRQAELIVRSYLCAIVSGVEPRTFWYNFRNDGHDPIYFEHQMGIVYQDFRPKAAYVTYVTMTQWLRGKRLLGPVPAPEGVLAFRFAAEDKPAEWLIAAWSPVADAVLDIPWEMRGAVRVNAVGERRPLTAAEGRLRLPLKVGAAVYLLPE